MSNHTPPPWRVIETDFLLYDGDHVADMSNGLKVVPSCELGDALADARLIAAAPELLQACQAFMNYRTVIELDKVVVLMGEAIAKATGVLA